MHCTPRARSQWGDRCVYHGLKNKGNNHKEFPAASFVKEGRAQGRGFCTISEVSCVHASIITFGHAIKWTSSLGLMGWGFWWPRGGRPTHQPMIRTIAYSSAQYCQADCCPCFCLQEPLPRSGRLASGWGSCWLCRGTLVECVSERMSE
jgi:hypothetical protein